MTGFTSGSGLAASWLTADVRRRRFHPLLLLRAPPVIAGPLEQAGLDPELAHEFPALIGCQALSASRPPTASSQSERVESERRRAADRARLGHLVAVAVGAARSHRTVLGPD